MEIASQPVQPSDYELPACGLCVADGCLKLGAGVALATLHLNVFGNKLPLTRFK
jgi:hypothetical protein